MTLLAYTERRERLKSYFDREAASAWAELTSQVKVSKIRETVREGRDRMRALLLSWLPERLDGQDLLDAGCGTGALSVAAAERGARVLGVDVAENLLVLARERAPAHLTEDRLRFVPGDMLDPAFGSFDHLVFMDSLIHYDEACRLDALAAVVQRTRRQLLFTFAPRTPLLAAALGAGRLFPRADRAPALEPALGWRLRRRIVEDARFAAFRIQRTERVSRGFYTSEALELVRR